MLRWVVLALLASGCVSPTEAPSTPEAGPENVVPAAILWTGCEQWHLHFNARAEDFAQEAPPGFTVTADAQGLTTLLIHVTLCDDVQEALIAVPVTPPAPYEDENRSEIAVVQVFHSGYGSQLYPEPFAPRLVDATFARSELPAGPALTITGGGETTELVTVVNPSSGAFGAEKWSRFAADGPALGLVTADGNESRNLGFGLVFYHHEGPGGAPPATAGIAHLVTDLDISFGSEVYG